jgi:hypothetical protein
VGQHKSNKAMLFNRVNFEPTTLAKEQKNAKKSKPQPLFMLKQNNFLLLPPGGPITIRGMTFDTVKRVMYVTDGTETIFILDMAFRSLGSILVKDGDTVMRGLIELAFVNGIIYANMEGRHTIARILPDTGDVVGWLYFDDGTESVARSARDSNNTIETDFSRSSIKFPDLVNYTLDKELDSTYKQMSGIAYHEAREMVLITGQQWPYMYRISSKEGLSGDSAETKSRSWIQDHCWSPDRSYRKELDAYENKHSKGTIWPSANSFKRFRDDIEENRQRLAKAALLRKHAASATTSTVTGRGGGANNKERGKYSLVKNLMIKLKSFYIQRRKTDFSGNRLHKLMKCLPRKTKKRTRATGMHQTLQSELDKLYRFT